MKNITLYSRRNKGFTVIEIIIVVAIIGILATLTIVGYNGVQKAALDNAVLSDIDSVEADLARFGTSHEGSYYVDASNNVAWYSASDPNANIIFTPSSGNVIDITASQTEYCIRVYNPSSATYGTLYTAAIRGSNGDACNNLSPSIAAQTDAGPTWATIMAGGGWSCGITSTDITRCWGGGGSGQLGHGVSQNSLTAVDVQADGALFNKTIKTMSAGNFSTCVIASDNMGYCWGYNANGRLGNNSTTNRAFPVAVSNTGIMSGKTLKEIDTSSNADFSCAIASDNLVYCWGINSSAGYLGNSSSNNSLLPVPVNTAGVLNGKTIKELEVGGSTCVIASDDLVYCWGMNSYGQKGNNSTSNTLVPTAVNTTGVLSGKTVKQLAVGIRHACAVASDEQIYCWGYNGVGQLGNGNTSMTSSSVPVAVDMSGVLSGKTIKTIASTGDFTCVVASDNLPYCWGDNANGKLGNNDTAASYVPVAVDTSGVLKDKTVKKMSVGLNNTCVIASNSLTYCWGPNTSGQLGTGNTNSTLVPVKVFDPAP